MPDEVNYAMHEPQAWVTIGIIVITVVFSAIGFTNYDFRMRCIFSPEYILRDRQGYRLVTSAFLHADWQHLLFNMYSFYLFGRVIELSAGIGTLLAVYFSSIIGGNLLSLFLHRHHQYLAYGASGGVSGIIYAFMFLFPGSDILMFFIPFGIPSWAYAIGYLLLSFYAFRKGTDNIGHDAHIGGAIIGLLTVTAMYPGIVAASPSLYGAVMLISVGIFVYLLVNPLMLPMSSFKPAIGAWRRRVRRSPPRPPPPVQEPDINAILDKISRSGMDSLTPAEHAALLRESRRRRPKSTGD